MDDRALVRDAVCCRVRATHPTMGGFAIVIVNISAQGLMARCEKALSEGDRLDVTLPIVGRTGAVIRWSLGGRIGCELDHVISLSDYYLLLSEMLKATPR
ncbi:MAG: pilus assembly protein PilZ [Sphingomonas sp.]|nr:pilus assembly protein PilZ [Sphingomonas sp.]